jgi:hypothetical protein
MVLPSVFQPNLIWEPVGLTKIKEARGKSAANRAPSFGPTLLATYCSPSVHLRTPETRPRRPDTPPLSCAGPLAEARSTNETSVRPHMSVRHSSQSSGLFFPFLTASPISFPCRLLPPGPLLNPTTPPPVARWSRRFFVLVCTIKPPCSSADPSRAPSAHRAAAADSGCIKHMSLPPRRNGW